MRTITSKKQIFDMLVSAIDNVQTVDVLIEKIREAFEIIYRELPLLVPYQINLEITEKLRYTEFYQAGPELSKHAIEIKGPKYCEYIWRDTGEWVLADEFYTAKEISAEICNSKLFTQVPETVKDLMFLLTQGYWKFVTVGLPKFGGVKPEDSLEVLSWDTQNLLVGTKLENIEILSREEWNNLAARETNWLQ